MYFLAVSILHSNGVFYLKNAVSRLLVDEFSEHIEPVYDKWWLTGLCKFNQLLFPGIRL
jgi:hypothetical protein